VGTGALRYRAGVTALCSRVDCSEAAVAVFGFDAASSLVWLDPYDGRGKGAGMLCTHHADTLTPLRGWTLVDRRVRAPRLWAERPRTTAPARSTPSRRARRPYHAVAEPADPLPFDGREPRPDTGGGGEQAARPELDDLLDARSPMLARAFQAARARDR
jgi:hypothetical protein